MLLMAMARVCFGASATALFHGDEPGAAGTADK